MTRDIIINFHGVGSPRRELEPGEAPYWVDRARFEEIVEMIVSTNANRIRLTFDDGNASDMDICAPLLASNGFTACVFVLASRIGTEGSLSESDLRELQKMGFEIGSHGYAHIDWRALDPESETRELVTARDIIAAACGSPVGKVAIPFGRYNRSVLSRLRRHRYEAVYTSDGGSCRPGAFIRPRTSVRSDMTGRELLDLLRSSESPRRRIRRRVSMLAKRLI